MGTGKSDVLRAGLIVPGVWYAKTVDVGDRKNSLCSEASVACNVRRQRA